MMTFETLNRPGRGGGSPRQRERAATGFSLSSPYPGLSHRWTNDPDGEAYCLDCFQTWRDEPDQGSPCDTERQRCESCEQHPAVVWDMGFAVCSSCLSGGRR